MGEVQGAGAGGARAGEPAAAAWLRAADRGAAGGDVAALARDLGAPGRGRDLWITAAPAPNRFDAALTAALATRGGAVLWEPGEALRPELVTWARPSLLAGGEAELLGLFEGISRLAPRFLARRWAGRRLARLRLLLLTSGKEQEVARAVERVTPTARPRILSFPEGRW